MKGKKILRILKMLVTDLVLAGVIALIFAWFHHVYPYVRTQIQLRQIKAAKEAEEVMQVAAVEEMVQETQKNSEDLSETAKTEEDDKSKENDSVDGNDAVDETDIVDARTEWQIRFEDKFTDEVIVTDHSYSSPWISVDIDIMELGEGNGKTVCYIADVYVGSIECLQTYMANDSFSVFSIDTAENMASESSAIVAISGDYYSYNAQTMVRNGVVYRTKGNNSDICVLYKNGEMKTFSKEDFTPTEIVQDDVWQIWNFGPALLDDQGEVLEEFATTNAIMDINPRSAIGYYEPGHYCLMVVDGRSWGWSLGLRMNELAELFHNLGCTCAYNLDGGGSAIMVYQDEMYSVQSDGGREISDIILITEPENAPQTEVNWLQ